LVPIHPEIEPVAETFVRRLKSLNQFIIRQLVGINDVLYEVLTIDTIKLHHPDVEFRVVPAVIGCANANVEFLEVPQTSIFDNELTPSFIVLDKSSNSFNSSPILDLYLFKWV